ncbi:MAG: sialate O-acetylesterase [Phycisphaerae bacterium]
MTIPGVTIDQGPMDWQVIQRDEKNVGRLICRGAWATEEKDFSVQARLVDERTNLPAAIHLDWQDARIDPGVSRFEITMINIPAGGLYRIETRIRRLRAKDPRPMRGDCIHHLAVGDIFIIAGQSNASGTGKGAADDGPALGVHLFANDEKWKLASHPLEDATSTRHPITVTGVFHGHSPWLAFGKRLLEKTGIPVGLIPCALGGSGLPLWVTDDAKPGVLFENMMDMVAKSGGRVAGVLWIQGESDALCGQMDHYERRFRLFVSLLREKMGREDLPIFTGQVNRLVLDPFRSDPAAEADWPRDWTQLREIQRRLTHEMDRVYLAVTIDCPLSDQIHNNAVAGVMVGHRFADLVLRHLHQRPLAAEFPEPSRVAFTDHSRRRIEVRFDHLSGDWTTGTGADVFYLEDETGAVAIHGIEICPDNRIYIQLACPAGPSPLLHAMYGLDPKVTLLDDAGRCLTPFSLPVKEHHSPVTGRPRHSM